MQKRKVKSTPEFDDDLEREEKGKDSRAIEKKFWAIVDNRSAVRRISLLNSQHDEWDVPF